MINLRDGLTQYVALRRALGTKLQEPAITLGRFLDFLEGEKASLLPLSSRFVGPCSRKVCNVQPGPDGLAW
jgi:hypothetical protein